MRVVAAAGSSETMLLEQLPSDSEKIHFRRNLKEETYEKKTALKKTIFPIQMHASDFISKSIEELQSNI